MDVVRETFKVNVRAIDAGLEPPVCVTWEVRTGWHDHVIVSRPVQSVDHQRMREFVRLMYEVHGS